jgi:hypothetical protein
LAKLGSSLLVDSARRLEQLADSPNTIQHLFIHSLLWPPYLDWIDEHFDEWKAGKFSIGNRRVLLTKWVGGAWEKVHKYHKDAIIKIFQNVGLSLPDGSRDSELSIRDLPNIKVGGWARTLKASAENPIVNPDVGGDTIEVDNEADELLYTAREVEQGIIEKAENEHEVTTDSGGESDQRFDYDSESDFDDDVDGDEDGEDEDIE